MSEVLGGIGIFLIGMVLMTEGLKSAAGDSLRSVLARFTRGPLSAIATGAGVTALVQSSSATTLTTIGFVSAGLLTFPQAIGVIFGANIGTTSTSWLVSALGLRVSVSAVALPLVGIGALLRLLGRDRVAALGHALAGFALVFIGIDFLQEGMSSASGWLDPADLPGHGVGGRVVLVLVGVVMTVIMQSSSAAAATTLTALHAGTLDLERASALVIGQAVGTTVTAGFAAIGASIAARRTALAHVLFNVLTGIVAFALLPVFLAIVSGLGHPDPALSLAAFHTSFKVLGVLLLLPFTRQFAAAIEKILPERGSPLIRHLDRSVTRLPSVAVEAALRALRATAAAAAEIGQRSLAGDPRARADLEPVVRALAETRHFLAEVRSEHESSEVHQRHLSALHAVDHLERLVGALNEVSAMDTAARAEDIAALRETLRRMLSDAGARLETSADEEGALRLAQASGALAEGRRRDRPVVLERTARGEVSPEAALVLLEAMRWIDRVGYHLARAAHHLRQDAAVAPTPEPAAP
jgi:phosphate:Na+ symporter